LNTARYDQVEDLLAKASLAGDAAARNAAYKAIVQKVALDIPVIPLYSDQVFMAHTDTVKGLVQNSLFTMQSYSVSLT
jgi:ABC-type transport system substrate-binding protein